MTKREISFIEAQIAQFDRWAEDEQLEAMCSIDHVEENKYHREQAALNRCSSNALANLLSDLKEMQVR